MAVTHLSECGKEKLKTGTSFPRIRGIQSVPSLQQGFSCGRSAAEVKPTRQSRWFKKMHLGLAGLLHFVRNDDKGVVNYGSINNVVLQERR